MGQGIIKIKDKYFVWSTIVDAPVTYGMDWEEVKAYVKEERGNHGLKSLFNYGSEAAAKEAIDKNGTNFRGRTAAQMIKGNRAGENEASITAEEIYEQYTMPQKILKYDPPLYHSRPIHRTNQPLSPCAHGSSRD